MKHFPVHREDGIKIKNDEYKEVEIVPRFLLMFSE